LPILSFSILPFVVFHVSEIRRLEICRHYSGQSPKCKNIFLSKRCHFSLQRLAMRRHLLEFSDAFAVVLQRHRQAKKLSRQVLAQKAGLHQTYIGMIERGLSNPTLDTANAIAEALEVPLAKLIDEAETVRNASQ
jgi:ribosome-binding protein aMBF1 (putative translation factor)